MNSFALMLPLMFGQAATPALSGPGCGPAINSGCYSGCTVPHPGMPNQPCPPQGPAAQILAVKALLPEGATINVLPGLANSEAYPRGTVFGFRPGYYYPLKIDSIPGYPGKSLYPVLEIRGTIVPRAGMKIMEITAPMLITSEDIERAMTSGIVTKVIYLENPELALPNASTPESPIELNSDSADSAENEARRNGRIMAILRLGDREPMREDLQRMTIPGTVLLPGESRLGAPAMAPCLPYQGVQLFDPLHGPKPLTEECLTNGGDTGDRLGVGKQGKVGGLNPSDVVAEYAVGNKKKVATSNTVCICSPRFVIRRSSHGPMNYVSLVSPDRSRQVVINSVFRQRSLVESAIAREKTLAFKGKEKPSIAVAETSLHAIGSWSAPQAYAHASGVNVVGVAVEPEEVSNFPDQLTLTKSVDPAGPVAQGTILTITIRYSNHTRTAIKDLVISDSLNGRLEYVTGSAASDRPSNISTTPNESGSVIVRFDLPGSIPPSSSGVVQFKVKVR